MSMQNILAPRLSPEEQRKVIFTNLYKMVKELQRRKEEKNKDRLNILSDIAASSNVILYVIENMTAYLGNYQMAEFVKDEDMTSIEEGFINTAILLLSTHTSMMDKYFLRPPEDFLSVNKGLVINKPKKKSKKEVKNGKNKTSYLS